MISRRRPNYRNLAAIALATLSLPWIAFIVLSLRSLPAIAPDDTVALLQSEFNGPSIVAVGLIGFALCFRCARVVSANGTLLTFEYGGTVVEFELAPGVYGVVMSIFLTFFEFVNFITNNEVKSTPWIAATHWIVAGAILYGCKRSISYLISDEFAEYYFSASSKDAKTESLLVRINRSRAIMSLLRIILGCWSIFCFGSLFALDDSISSREIVDTSVINDLQHTFAVLHVYSVGAYLLFMGAHNLRTDGGLNEVYETLLSTVAGAFGLVLGAVIVFDKTPVWTLWMRMACGSIVLGTLVLAFFSFRLICSAVASITPQLVAFCFLTDEVEEKV